MEYLSVGLLENLNLEIDVIQRQWLHVYPHCHPCVHIHIHINIHTYMIIYITELVNFYQNSAVCA